MTRMPYLTILALLLTLTCGVVAVQSAAPAATATLTVQGNVEKPLKLSVSDLQHMPRTTLKSFNQHENKEETYEGVALSEILKQAGAPQGPKLRGPALATYIVAEGSDGYRVVFSIAETDADFQDSEILVADKMNGQAMDAHLGPLRLVVPHDKRPARSVRMLQTIQLVTVSK